MFPKKNGTPKSSNLIGFSIINHPFFSVPLFLETPIWSSILNAASPPGGFVAWCCSLPEIGPPPRSCPCLEFIHNCEQLLRYQVDQDVAFDHQCWLKKLQYARFLDAHDQGHARACARLRNKDTPPLTELKECIREECSIVVEDPGKIWAYCDNPLQFIRQAPVDLDGSVCHIIALDNYGLLLQPIDSDRVWPEEGMATQDQVLTRPQDIVDRLNKFWMPYWAHPDSSNDMSSEFQVFLDALPELPIPTVNCSDPDLWHSAVKSLKPHSARGVDGISAAELQTLPATAIQQLATILCSFRGGFPGWLMVARTFAVPKCSTTPRSAEIRPITVLSQVYRLWARVICSQLLAHYSSLLPPEIWGLLRGRGPFSASYQLQWWLEKLSFQKVSNAGLVLDLVKCFNSIHRPTVYAILSRLGVPGVILQQWSCSLALLTRSWSLQGYDGQLTECVHGFPEGDVFSVLAMIGVALSWSSYLKKQCPASLIGAYADNWCLASTYKADFAILIKSTILFVRLLCMAIDWKKTWIWSTHKSLLTALKHALQSQLPSLSVERLTTAMDLGAQMTYSGPPRLGKFRNRLSHFKKRCHLLQSLPHDVYTKAHLARTSILPTLYGVALIPLGETHSVAMRTQLVNAILGYNHSRSSVIAMQYLPCVYDPGLWIILQAIEAARRYLVQATPVEASTFCHILSQHDGAIATCRGPVGCLKHYLLRLGWNVSKEGLIHVSPFVSLSLFTASKQSWVFWANTSWQQDLLLQTSRKAIHGNYAVNVCDTRAILHRLPANKCARIIQEISGAFQTAGQKQKWDHNATDLCQFCPAVDSRHHRVYDCPATAHIRLAHQEVIDFFRYHNDQMHELPVLIADPQLELLNTIHWTQPIASFDAGLVGLVQELIDHEHTPSFYTDGSCQFPELPTVRFASFSVVIDLCLSNDEREDAARGFKLTGVMPTSLKTILVSRTQGAQKISRSELFAVVVIVECFPAAQIYSDSQSTIDRFNLCRCNRDPLCVMDSDDSDLLLRLQVALTDRHFISKVTAHVDPCFCTNMLQCYHLLGNSMANDSAIKGCWNLHKWLVNSCNAKCLEIQHFRYFLAKWYDFLLELQQHCATLMSNRQSQPSEQMTARQHQGLVDRLLTWEVRDPWVMPELGLSAVEESSWGKLIATSMLQWMELFRWPCESQDDSFGVTWLELVISFSIFLGIYFPVPCVGLVPQHLVFLPDWESVQLNQIKLSDLANYFSIYFGQIDKLCSPSRWPVVRRGLVRSTYILGDASHSAGFVCRPQFPHQQQVVELLRNHFHSFKSQAHTIVPKLQFVERWKKDDLVNSIKGSWSQRSLHTQTFMRRFQKQVKGDSARGQRQQRLQFGIR